MEKTRSHENARKRGQSSKRRRVEDPALAGRHRLHALLGGVIIHDTTVLFKPQVPYEQNWTLQLCS